MKLSESFKKVFLLCKKLHNVELSFADNRKTVLDLEPEFVSHRLNNFWTKFKKLKAKDKTDKNE